MIFSQRYITVGENYDAMIVTLAMSKIEKSNYCFLVFLVGFFSSRIRMYSIIVEHHRKSFVIRAWKTSLSSFSPRVLLQSKFCQMCNRNAIYVEQKYDLDKGEPNLNRKYPELSLKFNTISCHTFLCCQNFDLKTQFPRMRIFPFFI